MRRLSEILSLALFLSCGAQDPREATSLASDAGDTSLSASACATDADCPGGMLCEPCGDFFTCVPGCRTDAQCGANRRCNTAVQCLSCPCPSGYCDLDPCRDTDGDGFAPATEGVCPGKQLGDCNDASPSEHPGAIERCANYRDDDCDGRTDARDDECQDSCSGARVCGTARYCGSTEWCDRGCCTACPAVSEPLCGAGQCLVEGGRDANGCEVAGVCVDCQSCPGTIAPVCGKNFASYQNACLAERAGTTVLHDGECDRLEGTPCFEKYDCLGNQYCRDDGQQKVCARVGTCITDDDCQWVTSVVSCGDAGVAPWVCRNERCTASCQ